MCGGIATIIYTTSAFSTR